MSAQEPKGDPNIYHDVKVPSEVQMTQMNPAVTGDERYPVVEEKGSNNVGSDFLGHHDDSSDGTFRLTSEEVNSRLSDRLAALAHKESEESYNPLSWLLGNVTEQQYLDTEPPDAGSLEHQKWRLAHMVSSERFRVFVLVIIAASSISIGLETDQHSDVETWMATLTVFNMAFAAEMTLKILGFGIVYFTDNWNVLDLTVVSLAWVEMLALWHAHARGEIHSFDNMTAHIAICRMARLARLFRLIQYFDRLNMLVWAFCRALQDIVWVLVLMVFVLYTFAVLATNFFGHNEHLSEELKPKGMEGLPADLFGTVMRSMLTLFQMMTLDSWMSGITRPIGDVYVMAIPFFMIFCFLAALGILNLLTAIFVESLAELSQNNSTERALLAQEEREQMVELVKLTFCKLDEDRSGTLDGEEVARVIETFRSPAYGPILRGLDTDIDTIQSFLLTSDVDGSGGIAYDDFCFGIMAMNQPTRQRDTWEIFNQVKRSENVIRKEVERLRLELIRTETNLNDKLNLILDYHRIPLPSEAL